MLTEQQRAIQRRMAACSSLKSLQIISALSICRSYMSVSELAEQTGLSASTIHRVLQELMTCGYVVKDEQLKKYRTGFEAMAMAMHLQTSDYFLEAAKSEMERLNDLSMETVNLHVLEGYQARFVGKLEAKNQIGLRSKVGWKIPLYCTSGGKVLLAWQPPKWLAEYFLKVPLKQFTDATITQEEHLRGELEKVRREGFAIDVREHNPDIICLAAPIFGGDGTIMGAIGIAAPDYRFSQEKALSYKQAVKSAAAVISERLAR